jgi:two-component system response regulator WspF
MSMRIAIVNDLAMAREALRRAVSSEPGVSIAWTAADGADAVKKAIADRPDLILMDLIMPGTDGVEATRQIMRQCPCAIVVVTATVEGNASRVYEAISAGAVDAVDTPRVNEPGGTAALVQRIEAIRKLKSRTGTCCAATAASALGCFPKCKVSKPVSGTNAVADHGPSAPLVAIGASTGGPQAIATVLQGLPEHPAFATLIVQHMDATFLPGLAHWLSDQTGRHVRLALPGQVPTAGAVLVAGEARHLVVLNRGTLCYADAPQDMIHKPSVDVLFSSLAASMVQPGVAVLLTGMGRDGAEGMLKLKQQGWTTIAQDQETSVVWGMPGAAKELGAASMVLPIGVIAPSITAGMSTQRAERAGRTH